jgi:acyl-coenzyme A synthetase/AMP-(fatty) acid ligase
LEARPRPLPSLRAFVNGGAALSDGVRDWLLAAVPHARVVDSIGSSESGRQTSRQYRAPGGRAAMAPLAGTVVVSEDRRRVLVPGDEEIGWLARSGRVPLGYLGDPEKTQQTFPPIDGVRYAVPGDRARWLADGTVEVLGRDAAVINTGGEKVFGEEVEAALVSHAAVSDAVVVGRPSPRWGQEVVALVALGAPVSTDALLEHAAGRLARYKLPKRIVVADAVPRTLAGKADHRAVHALLAAAEDRQAPTAEPRYSR